MSSGIPAQPRILLFSGRFQMRGSCAYTLRLAEGLPELGFQVEVVCPDANRVERPLRKQLHIHAYPHLQTPLWNRFVLELVARERMHALPDLIHIQGRNALRQGEQLARRFGRPYVITIHDYLPQWERFRLDQPRCGRIIAVSEPVREDFLHKSRLPPSLVTIAPAGVRHATPEQLSPVLAEGRIPVIGTAGPLETVKGFPYFIAAAAEVSRKWPHCEFVIAGAGPEERRLRRLTQELGLSGRVTFLPNIFDYADALEAMDIFVLPSLQQGVGTIMLEAMALGRPVIATRVGAVSHMIRDGENGLLAPPSNSGALASAIDRLLSSPALAQAIGSRARDEVSREFSVARMVQETAGVYREVLKSFGSLRSVG